jgi:hypothetical protein
MSHQSWAFALIGLLDVGNETPTLKARLSCYTAAFLIILAVVVLWL